MKDFSDVSPTEKQREAKIKKEKKLDEESHERRVKKEQKPEEISETPSTEAAGEKPKEETAAEKLKEKKKAKPARKPKPIEKIQYNAKKEVPEMRLEKKKPKFRRQEYYKKRLDVVWRKAIGIDSKQHEGKRGKGKIPGIGYKNPDAIQGLHPLGFRPVLVHNVKELSALRPKEDGAIIAAAVGRRKRNDMIKEANKLTITILNPRKGET
jgi:large subunit ribosomal protein L32e